MSFFLLLFFLLLGQSYITCDVRVFSAVYVLVVVVVVVVVVESSDADDVAKLE